MIPKKGPKKEPIVSIKDKIPIWLNNGSQNILITNPKKEIMIAYFFKVSFFGRKFKREFCEGM